MGDFVVGFADLTICRIPEPDTWRGARSSRHGTEPIGGARRKGATALIHMKCRGTAGLTLSRAEVLTNVNHRWSDAGGEFWSGSRHHERRAIDEAVTLMNRPAPTDDGSIWTRDVDRAAASARNRAGRSHMNAAINLDGIWLDRSQGTGRGAGSRIRLHALTSQRASTSAGRSDKPLISEQDMSTRRHWSYRLHSLRPAASRNSDACPCRGIQRPASHRCGLPSCDTGHGLSKSGLRWRCSPRFSQTRDPQRRAGIAPPRRGHDRDRRLRGGSWLISGKGHCLHGGQSRPLGISRYRRLVERADLRTEVCGGRRCISDTAGNGSEVGAAAASSAKDAYKK